MNILLDFGNSMQKMQIIHRDTVVCDICRPQISISDIQTYERQGAKNAILSSVVPVEEELEQYLQTHFHFIRMTTNTPIPIQNKYKEPSLGTDRLAIAVAAHHLYPHHPVLAIQMGTCITADFVNNRGEYLGGSIAPGLQMRLSALHAYSAFLPQISGFEPQNWIGDTTSSCIMSGVYYGIIDECNGLIARYKEHYEDIKIILSGGDAKMFKNSIKNEIFAFSNLVMTGLNIILNYNVNN